MSNAAEYFLFMAGKLSLIGKVYLDRENVYVGNKYLLERQYKIQV